MASINANTWSSHQLPSLLSAVDSELVEGFCKLPEKMHSTNSLCEKKNSFLPQKQQIMTRQLLNKQITLVVVVCIFLGSASFFGCIDNWGSAWLVDWDWFQHSVWLWMLVPTHTSSNTSSFANTAVEVSYCWTWTALSEDKMQFVCKGNNEPVMDMKKIKLTIVQIQYPHWWKYLGYQHSAWDTASPAIWTHPEQWVLP